jgi:hypothetical protein
VLGQVEEITRDRDYREDREKVKYLHPHKLREGMGGDDPDAAQV